MKSRLPWLMQAFEDYEPLLTICVPWHRSTRVADLWGMVWRKISAWSILLCHSLRWCFCESDLECVMIFMFLFFPSRSWVVEGDIHYSLRRYNSSLMFSAHRHAYMLRRSLDCWDCVHDGTFSDYRYSGALPPKTATYAVVTVPGFLPAQCKCSRSSSFGV